jgi:thiol-disulfide isomerase/thioredoxin
VAHGVRSGWLARLGLWRQRRLVRWSLDALLLFVLLLAVGAWQTRALPSGRAPSFVLPTLAGGTLASRELTGRPTLLVFWAPWCGVCRAESQNLSWLQSLLGARARVLSVAVQYDQRSEVEAYVAAQGVDYPVLMGGADAARMFRVSSYPTVFFLDTNGAIKRSAVGYTTTLGLLWRLVL